jgi:hypothetical protein
VVNEVEIRYWQVEVSLEYRPDKWNLQLPDVGWNYLDGGTKSVRTSLTQTPTSECRQAIRNP